jgi:hypothetical protein
MAKKTRSQKQDDAREELSIAAILLGVGGAGDAKLLGEYTKAVEKARKAGVSEREILKIGQEDAELGTDLLSTFSQLGSVTIGTSKGAVTLTPTKKARQLAAGESARLKKKYGGGRRSSR